MKDTLSFDFSVDKENKTITVKKELAAGLELVWKAFTQEQLLDQWWAPKPWKARIRSMDFKEGGTWLYAMVGPEGQEHWARFNFETIEKEKRFTGRDAFTDANGVLNTEMPQTSWEVKFSGKSNELTLVEFILTNSSLADLETMLKTGFREGFTIALQGLDEVLAATKK